MKLKLAEELIAEGFTGFDVDDLDAEEILEDKVFENIFLFDDYAQRTELIHRLSEKARKLNVLRSFNSKLKLHQTMYVQRVKGSNSNIIEVTDAPLKNLKCSSWICNDTGVYKMTVNKLQMPEKINVCSHPILPVESLWNIETNTERITLAFFKYSKWMTVTVPKQMISNANSIVMLSERGVSVKTSSSSLLVDYLGDVIDNNENIIPQNNSISRLGWIENEFSPYVSNLKYDGDLEFKGTYEALKESGDFEQWKKHCTECRKFSKVAQLILASSFASPLISKLGVLPYIVHMWGGTGAGKTVAIFMAMSVWGNPAMGKLTKVMNMTQVALGRTASFLHSIPFAGDELQIIKDKWTNLDNLVMFLSQGLDRGRGKAFGGVEEQKTWECNFIFSGEEPITKPTSGGGVKNRVIEIYTDSKVIQDGVKTADFYKNNYGFAGREYIEQLPSNDELMQRYKDIRKRILDTTDTSEKQAMAMATILLADEISTELFFKGTEPLTIDDVKEFLLSEKEVDVAERSYDWVINWIAQNQNKFSNETTGEVWGKIEDNYCLVNKNVLVENLKNNNFEFSSSISKWAERGQIEKNSQGKNTHQTHVRGIKGNYIKININSELFNDIEMTDEPPF